MLLLDKFIPETIFIVIEIVLRSSKNGKFRDSYRQTWGIVFLGVCLLTLIDVEICLNFIKFSVNFHFILIGELEVVGVVAFRFWESFLGFKDVLLLFFISVTRLLWLLEQFNQFFLGYSKVRASFEEDKAIKDRESENYLLILEAHK